MIVSGERGGRSDDSLGVQVCLLLHTISSFQLDHLRFCVCTHAKLLCDDACTVFVAVALSECVASAIAG